MHGRRRKPVVGRVVGRVIGRELDGVPRENLAVWGEYWVARPHVTSGPPEYIEAQFWINGAHGPSPTLIAPLSPSESNITFSEEVSEDDLFLDSSSSTPRPHSAPVASMRPVRSSGSSDLPEMQHLETPATHRLSSFSSTRPVPEPRNTVPAYPTEAEEQSYRVISQNTSSFCQSGPLQIDLATLNIPLDDWSYANHIHGGPNSSTIQTVENQSSAMQAPPFPIPEIDISWYGRLHIPLPSSCAIPHSSERNLNTVPGYNFQDLESLPSSLPSFDGHRNPASRHSVAPAMSWNNASSPPSVPPTRSYILQPGPSSQASSQPGWICYGSHLSSISAPSQAPPLTGYSGHPLPSSLPEDIANFATLQTGAHPADYFGHQYQNYSAGSAFSSALPSLSAHGVSSFDHYEQSTSRPGASFRPQQ
ncbi:hypothetical protein BJ138DRAFT_13480 [Hygrophoropsis aurantiaca]|uniref:Uncharacterized protein n=1 Tax=Hygrophoropsis aurantiaca TaxID=72124 RepID=A0ACB8ATT3_9AGAM|nr:hypothetical protein BJ138DRAFT_13480 [Hygrophoropsis aurantiaca]